MDLAGPGGRLAATLLGGALLVLLIVLQGWLVRRFRRRVNPALLIGTLLTFGLVASAGAVFAAEGRWLTAAHRDNFAPYLALSGAQAISYDAASDTSRYLLSARLPSYRQDFARKSDCLVKGGQCGVDGAAYSGEVLNRWLGYQRAHDRVVALADSGQTAAAVDAPGRVPLTGGEGRQVTLRWRRLLAAARSRLPTPSPARRTCGSSRPPSPRFSPAG